MTGEPCPDPACELCGDRTPGAARTADPDRGWDALCHACWQLQQPPDETPLWARPRPGTGLGRFRRQGEA